MAALSINTSSTRVVAQATNIQESSLLSCLPAEILIQCVPSPTARALLGATCRHFYHVLQTSEPVQALTRRHFQDFTPFPAPLKPPNSTQALEIYEDLARQEHTTLVPCGHRSCLGRHEVTFYTGPSLRIQSPHRRIRSQDQITQITQQQANKVWWKNALSAPFGFGVGILGCTACATGLLGMAYPVLFAVCITAIVLLVLLVIAGCCYDYSQRQKCTAYTSVELIPLTRT